MNPITWLRWRMRVPDMKGGPIAQLGQLAAWHETKVEDAWLRRLPSLQLRSHPDRRLRFWVVTAALWHHAARTRKIAPELVNDFFAAFWPVFTREAMVAVPRIAASPEEFSSEVAGFLPSIQRPPGTESKPENYAWFLAKAVWTYIAGSEPETELPEMVALSMGLSEQLIARAQLLDKLPGIQPVAAQEANEGDGPFRL